MHKGCARSYLGTIHPVKGQFLIWKLADLAFEMCSFMYFGDHKFSTGHWNWSQGWG